jgi:predicted dehydrogenase
MTTRRQFIKRAALTSAGLIVLSERVWAQSPNEKLNIGIIGCGGQGASDMGNVSGENIVALCDVDENTLRGAAEKFPSAKTFTDYRRLLDLKEVEAVTVSIPDHSHAAATLRALQSGRHVYCQKPLTHSVWEARAVREEARRNRKLATQMGNQGHSNDASRRTVELIQAGVIGPIHEVHAWTDRPIWPQGMDVPAEAQTPPATLNWDAWLGPAAERPYNSAYLPFVWRGWWDFGTGALGDMACHVLDVTYWSLDLRDPTTITAQYAPGPAASGPKWSEITYQFPARGRRGPVKLTWYDGGHKPPTELFEGENIESNGSLFIGEKGKIYLPDPYGSSYKLLPAKQFEGFSAPPPTIPNSIGHHAEWIAGAKHGTPTGSNFEYATGLTEMVLLGNLALRLGKPVDWDARRMRVKGQPAADRMLRPEFRAGWVPDVHGVG